MACSIVEERELLNGLNNEFLKNEIQILWDIYDQKTDNNINCISVIFSITK